MKTAIAAAILAACASHSLPQPPKSFPSPYPPLVEYTFVDACTTIADAACADDCGRTCFEKTYLACCNGQPCEDYAGGLIYAPSDADVAASWKACIASEASASCGSVTLKCQLVAPSWPPVSP